MTWDEAAGIVRSVNRTCRGNFNFTSEQMAACLEKWGAFVESKDLGGAYFFLVVLSARIGWTEPPGKTWQDLETRFTNVLFSMKGNCGYDVNTLILEQPLDGKDHKVTCPKCGELIRYTAPYFPLDTQ